MTKIIIGRRKVTQPSLDVSIASEAHTARMLQALLHACLPSKEDDPIDNVFRCVCRATRKLLKADGACVIVREGESIHYLSEDTIAPLWAGQSFPISNCISGWSILHNTPVMISDIYCDERIPKKYYETTFVHSLAVQPCKGAAIGAYWQSRHSASATELKLLEGLAAICGLHLDIAKLRQERDENEHRAQTLLAMVAHELRGNLNLVKGWVTVADRQQADPGRRRQAMDMVKRALDQESGLIEDLIDKACLLSNSFRISCRNMELGSLVRECVEQSRLLADSRNLQIHLRLPASPVNLSGDEARLKQVVVNLLTNACKFGRPGGNIWIEVEVHGPDIELTISDDGCGIAPDKMHRIFDPFYRATGNEFAQHTGIGMGLAIVERIVKAHGGIVEVSSPGVGKGSSFKIRIPAQSTSTFSKTG